ncbi:regulator of telomere elongation helicase 1 homolog [Paramacrobiotus metropolitanus]|uniref:regulator of telomere elongation helicase 1 homolog n=1 Tax=Paramacrobiotus metropolitanus TaxID=2943436 RepID=UPI0024456C99|nr:regulator of telomere elongation helicase 1 homolog [Paramacrobiotus metropolitanus]
MPSFDIEGIHVEFPYEAYDIQISYMTHVIKSLKSRTNALLESPTGTGKTLCLLCASLAWLEHEKARQQLQRLTGAPLYSAGAEIPDSWPSQRSAAELTKALVETKIIYASRTHSQLAQVMQELKKTRYRNVRVATLGSRDQLCINPQVSQLPNIAAKNKVCRDKVNTRSCKFYVQLEQQAKESTLAVEPAADIEDLLSFGKKNRVCPYYLAKSYEKSAEVIFMPYNYIFDPTVRRTIKLDLMNAVIILDEGHNVGKVCEDSYSYEISSTDLATTIRETGRILNHLVKSNEMETASGSTVQSNVTRELQNPERSEKTRAVATLKRTLLDFEAALDELSLPEDASHGWVRPMTFMKELFSAAKVNQVRFAELSTSVSELLAENENKDQFSAFSSHNAGSLQKFVDLMEVVFSKDVQKHHPYFRVYVRKEDVKKRLKDGWSGDGITTKQNRVISIWCMSPGCTIQTIMQSEIHSMIITSGTLTPAEPLLKELAVPFPIQLYNPHVISGSQVWVGVISKGPDGIQWNSQFKNRDSVDYKRSLGRGILNFLEVIPDGVLIFFPSYRVMDDCITCWKSFDLWEGMSKKKACFVEPTNRNEFTTMLSAYFQAVRENGPGAAFFGVCRGKISEGVDFPDVCARGVILTGLPYPNRYEPRIRVKMEYLQQTYGNVTTRTLTGEEWYNREAWSTVNQALGRVIRHAKDFGACLLCDMRFENESSKKQLSGWVRNSLRNYAFPVGKRALADFFRGHCGELRLRSSDVIPLENFGPEKKFVTASVKPERETSMAAACAVQKRCAALQSDAHVLSLYSGAAVSKTKRNASVFAAMDASEDSAALENAVPAIASADIPSTFSSLATQSMPVIRKKIVVKPNKSAELNSQSGPAQRFVDLPRESSVVASAKSSNDPAEAGVKERNTTQVSDTLSVLRTELNHADYAAVSRALSILRKPECDGCASLTEALRRVEDSSKRRKIALLLSRYIPVRSRQEYDRFLDGMGYVITL